MSMRKTMTLIMSILFSSTLCADASAGKLLFDEANCIRCHSADIFTHEDRKVTNHMKLKDRVQRCAFTTNAGWFESDSLDVVKYLNLNYYNFKEANNTKIDDI